MNIGAYRENSRPGRALEIAAILALFLAAPLTQAATNTWLPLSGTNDWFVGTNWSGGSVPTNGDDVVITNSSGTTTNWVLLTNSTYSLGSILLSNRCTLLFSNWDTTLFATNVSILSNAGMTCYGSFSNNTMSNRVYIVCSNFNIAAGGSINVDTKGYIGGYGATVGQRDGQGPGGGTYNDRGGGYGGGGGYAGGEAGGAPYGSASAPLFAGSGGGGSYSGGTPFWGGSGGGTVYINASGGTVNVNGTITANGGAKLSTYGGGGSGGGIYIQCYTFSGTNGLIRANGGNGVAYSDYGGGGGGGRIAVVYDSSAQSNVALSNVTFSASRGTLQYFGQPGTLYFPDNQFLSETVKHSGQWSVPGFTNWAPNNLTLSNVYLSFPSPGFQLTITNDLTILGTNYHGLDLTGGVVACGGNVLVQGTWLTLYAGTGSGPRLAGDGNLTLTNGVARFYVYSAATNAGPTNYGALISVTGHLVLASNTWIYSYSDITNGGSPFFQVGSVTVASNAGFSAAGLGYRAGYGSSTAASNIFGPGGGRYNGGGGGHGGAGGLATGGGTYGDSNAPILAGSGAGGSWSGGYPFWGGSGGGVVRILATNNVTVNGTITVNGNSKPSTYGGGGAGGSIYIRCRRFSGAYAVLRANGGSGLLYGPAAGGGGGGGRIAIWRIWDDTPGGTLSANLIGGTDGVGSTNGVSGTIVWGQIPFPGTIITFR